VGLRRISGQARFSLTETAATYKCFIAISGLLVMILLDVKEMSAPEKLQSSGTVPHPRSIPNQRVAHLISRRENGSNT
jgi:hypothetical protein